MIKVKEGGGPVHDCPLGGTVITGGIQWLEVPEFFRARIYRGPSLGVRDRTAIFHAGRYDDAWLYGKWLQSHHGRGPKYIQVEATAFRAHELLCCSWREKARDGKWRAGYQRFEPGDFEYVNGDFRNDVFETVEMPMDATAELWDGSHHTGRRVPFTRPGTYELEDNELDRRISSLSFKHDEWKEISQRLGEERSSREIGKPVIVPFKATGLPGAVLHPFVNLGRTKENETNWHLDQRVGISATIGTGESSPVKAEFTVSSETEAGGGGAERGGFTQESGISVDAAADDNGILEGFIRAQLREGEQQVFRTLENVRTKETTEDEGEITGQFDHYEVHFQHGKGVV